MSKVRPKASRVLGTLALLGLYPFTLLFPVFWGMDGMYRGLRVEEGRIFAIDAGKIDDRRPYVCSPPEGSLDSQQNDVFHRISRGTTLTYRKPSASDVVPRPGSAC